MHKFDYDAIIRNRNCTRCNGNSKDEVMFYSLPSGNEIFQLRFKRIRVEAKDAKVKSLKVRGKKKMFRINETLRDISLWFRFEWEIKGAKRENFFSSLVGNCVHTCAQMEQCLKYFRLKCKYERFNVCFSLKWIFLFES